MTPDAQFSRRSAIFMAAMAAMPWPLTAGAETMPTEPTNARNSFGDIAPHLAEITDKVLFGDVWENAALKPRDRSLVTITCLIAMYRINEMPFHIRKALDNGVTRDEIVEAVTQIAFYAGWPPAMTALPILKQVFAEAGV
nr:carboxymuconolactone decarboxylase family protein [Novosphingobium panipatense]